MSGLRVVPVDAVPSPQLVAAIADAFDRPLTMDWFRWKHEDGPWGASWGLVALEGDTVAGVRLLLPWRLRVRGAAILVHRAVEAATVPRARGRGLFRLLNQALMDDLAAKGRWTATFSTPNTLSRDGYRKLGWWGLDPIPHEYRAVRWRRAALDDDPDAAPTAEATDQSIGTDWDATALRWRTDPRSGHRYRRACLVHASSDTGLVYRTTVRSGVRVLLPMLSWGPEPARATLLGAIARRERAPVVLQPVGPGTPRCQHRTGLRRGSSLVLVWEPDGPAQPPRLGELDRWSLDMVDLESVL